MRSVTSAVFTALLLVAVSLAVISSPIKAAAPGILGFSQTCTGDKADVGISWQGDPAAREIWVDLSTSSSFAPDTFTSAGPLSGRTFNYAWKGLDPHTAYYWRVNQQLPSGDWEPSQPTVEITGCGNVASNPGAKIDFARFSDRATSSQASMIPAKRDPEILQPRTALCLRQVLRPDGNHRCDHDLVPGYAGD